MSLAEETPVLSSVANGVTTSFPYSFTVLAAGDLVVTATTTAGVPSTYALGTHYTLTGIGTAAGSVEFLVAPANGLTITRYRDSTIGRSTDYQSNGDLLAATVNLDFNRIWLVLQEFLLGGRGFQSAIRLPDGEVTTPLPSPAVRKGFMLGFDAVTGAVTLVTQAVGSVGAYATSVASTSGASLVGVDLTQTYVAGTIGAILQDNAVNVMAFLNQTERAQVKAGGTTLDLTPKINAAKTWAGNRPLYFPAGTWSLTSFNGKGWYGGLIGDGMTQTILKVRSAVTVAFDFAEASDVIVSPFVIKSMTIDGDAKAGTIIDVRYRHHYVIEDVLLTGATSVLLNAKDTWLNTHRNCRFTSAPTLVYLRGSNHRNTFQGCAFTANTVWQLKVESNGTAADGNEAILCSNCDFEFSGVAGGGIYFKGSSLTLLACYIGEDVQGPVIQVDSGAVEMLGGVLFFGKTTASVGLKPFGGKTRVVGAIVNGQTNSAFQYLIDGSTGTGTVQFVEVLGSMTIGGDQTVLGNPLDYGPPSVVFAKRLGRAMTGSGNNATVTPVVSGNQLSVACTAAPGPTPNMTITNLLTQVRPEWREGEALFLVVVYQSNAAFNVRLSGGAFGAAPTQIIGVMPATAGATRTYIKLDASIPAGNYDRLEFYRDNVAVSESLTIVECFVSDSRMLDPGTGNVGNLYKC